MTQPVFDSFADARLDAVAKLLRDSLIARFGENIVRSVHKWPVPLGMIPGSSGFPALAIYRDTARQEAASAYEDDVELTTFRLRYYLPPTPSDRAAMRWPALQKVWKHCIGRLRYGRDPDVEDVLLGSECFEIPGRVEATVRFHLAPESESRWVPMFDAAVVMRSSDDFDIEFETDDLLRIQTKAMLADDEHPEGTEPPAFESFEGEPEEEGP